MTINQLTHEIIGAAMEVHRVTNRRDAKTQRQTQRITSRVLLVFDSTEGFFCAFELTAESLRQTRLRG